MNTSVKISIIVPSYNQGKYIENVILSTMNQTYSNWELIVQDGASKDCTAEVCERYCKIDERIKFYSEKDKGFADAVNKALDKATGELCVIQSSDDFFACNSVFADAINIYSANDGLILITGAAVVVDEELNGLRIDEKTKKYIPFENVYILKDHFSQGATFFPRQRAFDIGKLDPLVDMVADTDFWVRMTCSFPTSVNSIYQTSRIWGGVMLQEEQRSMDLSNFYFGRAKMATLHLNNTNIKFDIDWKRRHANNLIVAGVEHFRWMDKDPNPFYVLYREINDLDFPIDIPAKLSNRARMRNLLRRLIIGKETQREEKRYNSKIDSVFSDKGCHSLTSYKWFKNNDN